jgi:hypothetical protein
MKKTATVNPPPQPCTADSRPPLNRKRKEKNANHPKPKANAKVIWQEKKWGERKEEKKTQIR